MTFLIAEDNARMRTSIIRYIKRSIPDHHVFLEAVDGNTAIALYESCLPDWVLMDIEMNPMDGLTASQKIISEHPAAKIIILTSYDDKRYRTKAETVGVWSYVLKEHLNTIPSIVSAHGESSRL